MIGKRIVILHQFTKKTEKTPPKELVLARRRMKEVKDADAQRT
jgi:phage-related protein